MILFVFQAPVVRKVFFEIVDGSVEKEAETTVAPTVAAIPEAISTDPVFQVPLSFFVYQLFLFLCRRLQKMRWQMISRREVSGRMTRDQAKCTRTSTMTPTATGITSAGATRPLP